VSLPESLLALLLLPEGTHCCETVIWLQVIVICVYVTSLTNFSGVIAGIFAVTAAATGRNS
ncbi:hypothetical protein Tco_1305578, partial [Tanacetum coccineum]